MTRQVGKLLKAILILPVNVLIVIPALILFFSDDRRELPSAGTAVLGGLFFCVGLFLVVSTMRLFWKEGLGTPGSLVAAIQTGGRRAVPACQKSDDFRSFVYSDGRSLLFSQ